MTSLYEALGSSPDASQEQLQQAYRRAARRLHPDVNSSAEADEAMRALNDAWAILGKPDRRRRYDAEMRLIPARPTTGPPQRVPASDEDLVPPRRGWLLRPSVVALAILAVIFIITAYAGPSNRQKRSTFTTVPPQSSLPAPNQGSPEQPQTAVIPTGTGLVAKCILKLLGYDAVVACNQRGAQAIVAEVASTADCPPGTTVYQLEGRFQLVCLTPSGS